MGAQAHGFSVKNSSGSGTFADPEARAAPLASTGARRWPNVGQIMSSRYWSERRVLRISIAIVIGPTPPGTGVIAPATSTAFS